jgi:hypothetical protein
MEVIWTLLLTVCMDNGCLTQDIQWFEDKQECIKMKVVHEDILPDGHWKTVDYKCTIKGSLEI